MPRLPRGVTYKISSDLKGKDLEEYDIYRSEKYLLPRGTEITRFGKDAPTWGETFVTTRDAIYDRDEVLWPTLKYHNDGSTLRVRIYLPDTAYPYRYIECRESSLLAYDGEEEETYPPKYTEVNEISSLYEKIERKLKNLFSNEQTGPRLHR